MAQLLGKHVTYMLCLQPLFYGQLNLKLIARLPMKCSINYLRDTPHTQQLKAHSSVISIRTAVTIIIALTHTSTDTQCNDDSVIVIVTEHLHL